MKTLAALVFAALVAAGAASAVAPPPHVSMAVGSSGKILPTGEGVDVAGTVLCPRGYRFSVVVQVVQHATGGYATGGFPGPRPATLAGRKAVAREITCSGLKVPHPWSISATSRGKVILKFKPGTATACALVRFALADNASKWVDLTSGCATVRLS